MKKMTASPRWRVALASAASAALLVAAPLAATQTAYAQPYPPSTRLLSVSRTDVSAGDSLSFSSRDVFAPGAGVTALLESTPVVLGHFRADAHGAVSGTVTIPRSTPGGWHVFRLTSDNPDPSIGTSIYVEGVVGSPPPTSPPPTSPPPTHHPRPEPSHTHHPGGHHGDDGGHHHGQGDDGRNPYDPGRDPHHGRLADTGSEKAMALGGAAAALLLTGSGTMLAVRRRRNS